MTLTLFSNPISTNSMKVRFLLAELGLAVRAAARADRAPAT